MSKDGLMNSRTNLSPRDRRILELQQYGCLACRQLGYIQPADLHHLLSGGKRRGDQVTVPLCEFHHRGVWNTRFTSLKLAHTLCGPSLALEPKAFRERFGTDEKLLAEANEHCTHRRINPEND
jgi:Recombination enhancement, RecA-dependent nuclease